MALRRKSISEDSVFLNIPYDEKFKPLYLAYIAGLVNFGLIPVVTLGLPGGTRRLEKIFALIQDCRYSIHDISRVTLDDKSPPTPRFNMPFELGLAVAWEALNPTVHSWFVFEEKSYRLQKSLSDLNGTDPQIHGGTVSGVFRELTNIFKRDRGQPTVPQMMKTYKSIASQSAAIQADTGASSLYEAEVFRELCYQAKIAVEVRSA